jgi:ABC-2 type transport system permease protein
MNKTLLVAQREYLEHMRTKTFWIGILAVPVLIVISIVVGRVLANAKDVRTYAVLDRSEGQWLSQAVEEQAAESDFRKMLDEAKDKKKPTPEEMREQFRQALGELDENDPLRDLFELYLEFDDKQLEALASGDQFKIGVVMLPYMGRIQKIVSKLDPAEIRSRFGTGIDLTRYRQIPLAELIPEGHKSDGGGDPEAVLREKVEKGELFAYFVIDENPISLDQKSRYVSNNVTDDDLRKWFAGHATDVVRKRRVAELDLAPDEVRMVTASFALEEKRIDETGEEADVKTDEKLLGIAPVAFVYMLWIAIFSAANMLLTNTIEEKSNRIIEVLLSSVSPMQLMAGKIWGIGAVGLTIVGSWALFALAAVRFAPLFFDGGNNSGMFDALMSAVGNPFYLTSFVGYFLAGYLLYAALLVAIGSVCNSLKEAQNLMQPVMILLIVPLIAMVPVMNDPNGTVARVLTYVPTFTPFLMMNRAGGPPPMIEYVVTSILLVVTIAFAFIAAGRVFRVGVLMTGKPPKITEILRWMFAGKLVAPSTQRKG